MHEIGIEAIVLCSDPESNGYPHRITLLQPIKDTEVIDHRVTPPENFINIILTLTGRIDMFKVFFYFLCI